MAVTEASLLAEVKRLVYSSLPFLRPWEDQVQDVGGISAVDTTVDVADGSYWSVGDIVAFADGTYDLARVTSVSTNTLTIQRNVRGATASAHSQNAEIEKNPRFTDQEIKDAFTRVINDLYPRVYKLTKGSATFSTNTYWYALSNDNIEEILTVYREEDTYLNPEPLHTWRFSRDVDPTEFSDDQGIFVPHGGDLADGETFYWVGREKLAGASDLLDRQAGLVALGTVYHLLGAEDAARTYDPGRQTDRTVQPGQNSRDSLWFWREFSAELRNEELRLLHEEDRLPKSHFAERARRFRV